MDFIWTLDSVSLKCEKHAGVMDYILVRAIDWILAQAQESYTSADLYIS